MLSHRTRAPPTLHQAAGKDKARLHMMPAASVESLSTPTSAMGATLPFGQFEASNPAQCLSSAVLRAGM